MFGRRRNNKSTHTPSSSHTEAPQSERRSAPRCEVFTYVSFGTNGLWAADISMGGMLLTNAFERKTAPLTIGEYSRLRFSLPKFGSFEADAQLLRIEPGPQGLQHGFRFCGLNDEAKGRIKAFVDTRLGHFQGQAESDLEPATHKTPVMGGFEASGQPALLSLFENTFRRLREKEIAKPRMGCFVPSEELWTLSRILGRYAPI